MRIVRRALPILLAAGWFAGFGSAGGAARSDRASVPPRPWPKVIHLRDGSTVSVWRNGRVVQRDRRGTVLAESYCGSYARYRRWVEFMSFFRTAVLSGDRTWIAARVAYPLLWNHGRSKPTTIDDRKELLREYGAIFQPRVIGAIKAADPRGLFCRNVSMVMLDTGVVWGGEPRGQPAIVSVNPVG